MQPRVEEDLVRVDVAYAGDNFLIQNQRLYLGPPGTEGLAQIFYTEPLIEGLRAQRREPRLQLARIEQPRPREARLIPQEQPPIFIQMEDEHQRRPRLLHRGHQQQLAPDLELEDEGVAGTELDDEVLGPAARPSYPDASKPAGELRGRSRLLDEGRVEHLGALDPRAHDQLAQILLYGLHLGQLRHGCIYTPSAGPRFPHPLTHTSCSPG